MSVHRWKLCQAMYETIFESKNPPSGKSPLVMMLMRPWSLKPPVCSGVWETSTKMLFVAVSPWQFVQAGPTPPCSSGLPGPIVPPCKWTDLPSLYLALPISQSASVAAVTSRMDDPHLGGSSLLFTLMTTLPAFRTVMRTSLGRSPSAIIPTIVESALHVTEPFEPP